MLSASGNPLNNTNSSNNTNNGATNPVNNKAVKTNLLTTSSLMTGDFMLPTINNLNTNPMAASSYINDYNKLYRDAALFQPAHQATLQQPHHQQPQPNKHTTANLIGNNLVNNLGSLSAPGSTLNNLVVNNISNLNSMANHSNNLSSITSQPAPHTPNSLNGLPANHKHHQQQLINNPDFMFYLNRCNQFLDLNMYQQALDEISLALSLASTSAQVRFRKAQALLGLKRFYECEKELWNCINLEPNVLEYHKELLKVKQLALMSLNLNLDHNTVLMLAQKYDSIKEAVDSLMWSNNLSNGMIDFNYGNQVGAFQSSPLAAQENASLMNGWNMNLNAISNQPTNNRFGSMNQLISNGNNLLFNSAPPPLMAGNLLLNNMPNNVPPTPPQPPMNNSLVNRSNNGQSVVSNSGTVATSQAAAVSLKQQQAPNSSSSNNLLNSNASSSPASIAVANSNSSSVSTSIAATAQPTSNSSSLSDVTACLTNGLSGLSNNLSNGSSNRFNYLLRGLDQTHHPLLSAAAVHQQQSSTNGQNSSNQNLINNQQQHQQQLYNRIMPSFIDNTNNTASNSATVLEPQQSKSGQAAVLNCTRSLASKLTLNEPSSPSILNGTNGLLMSSAAPSPICSKLTSINSQQQQQATTTQHHPHHQNNSNPNNLSTNSSSSLTNSCNYNIFNQMPEMKLIDIETIVPNLLGSLSAGNTSLSNQNSNTSTAAGPTTNKASQATTSINNHTSSSASALTSATDRTSSPTTNNHKLLASLATAVASAANQQAATSRPEMNKVIAVKDSLLNSLVHQQPPARPLSQEGVFEDCNKSANKQTDLSMDKLLLATVTSTSNVIDLKDSNNSVKEDCSLLLSNINSLTTTPRDIAQASAPLKCESINADNHHPATSLASNNQASVISSSPASTSSIGGVAPMQCTSYSDIVKRAKKISQQSSTIHTITNTNGGLTGSLSSTRDSISHHSTSTHKSDGEANSNADDSVASKRPTNLWGYNGLRVANVSLTASKSSLMSLFTKFGRIRLLERIINKTTTNNIWVYYDNPISPVDAVTKLQNVYLEGICVDSDSPLRLFFAPTDDQKDLKFSRPKQPPDNKGRGECYYWRTTNCFSKEQCPLLHIQANKNIDAQVWMRVNPENTETPAAVTTATNTASKEGEEDESSNQNAENTNNEIASSDRKSDS